MPSHHSPESLFDLSDEEASQDRSSDEYTSSVEEALEQVLDRVGASEFEQVRVRRALLAYRSHSFRAGYSAALDDLAEAI